MHKIRNMILLAAGYLLTFAVTVIIASFIMNQNAGSGNLRTSNSTLPVMYVKAGGMMVNEMHGYKVSYDSGQMRDSVTPVSDSKTVNLCMSASEMSVASVEYTLYDETNTTLIEEGSGSAVEVVDAYSQSQIVFQTTLAENREYCLNMTVTDSDGSVVYYYTRIRYGEDMKVAEKLKFVLDFNDATFKSGGSSLISSYLESDGSDSDTDLSYASLYSSSSKVTWGNLEPYRTGDIVVKVKEINGETASVILEYSIESTAGDMTTAYDVTEYYRLRWTSSRIYLLDFERRMAEDISSEKMVVENGQMRLGIEAADSCRLISYGTEEQQFASLRVNGQLWQYDYTNRIMTCIYGSEDNGHNCGLNDQYGLKVLRRDDDGNLYFLVYGYMHDGDYEGQNGIMIYRYTHSSVSLEELLFIPCDENYEQLQESIGYLAYMDGEGNIYLKLGSGVYELQPELSRSTLKWENVTADNSAVSADNRQLVLTSSDEKSLEIIDLSDGSSETLSGGDNYIVPMGFNSEHLIYGLIDPALVKENSEGITEKPVSELHIVDGELNEVRTFSKNGYYIMGIALEGENIRISMASQVSNGAYTDYKAADAEYIFSNAAQESQKLSLVSISSTDRGMQLWINFGTSNSFDPITQTARSLTPSYDITETVDAEKETTLKYYVYTKGEMSSAFGSIKTAVDFCNENAGVVVDSNKHIVWQRAQKSATGNVRIKSIGMTGTDGSETEVLLKAIAAHEGVTLENEPAGDTPFYASLEECLPFDAVNLSGISLEDALYYIYRGCPVIARADDGHFLLVTGYDGSYVQIADPEKGSVYNITQSSAENMFKTYSNTFYSYFH